MKIPIILSLGAISAMASLVVAKAEPAISSARIRDCVPSVIGRQFIDSLSPLAATEYQSDTYIMVSATGRNGQMSPQSQFPMILKFSDSEKKCSIPFLDPMGDGISYSTQVPEPVAHELMLQQWKLSIKQFGGTQQYEDRLTQVALEGNGILELNKDEFWAYQQLGFRLPSPVKVRVIQR